MVNKCYFKRVGVPKGKFTWFSKGEMYVTNIRRPKFVYGT